MKISKMFKVYGVTLLAAYLAVGCASAPEESKQPEQPVEQKTTEVQKPAEPVAAMANYQVVKGDSLWTISGKDSVYGNPYQWPLIYKANSDQIKDADLIYPGQTLAIDSNPTAAETAAAVQHAKTRGSWSIGAVEASDKAYLGN